jgi:hypothetical protein
MRVWIRRPLHGVGGCWGACLSCTVVGLLILVSFGAFFLLARWGLGVLWHDVLSGWHGVSRHLVLPRS